MKILTGLFATLALLFVVATPASASCTITINGVSQDCSAPVVVETQTNVNQSNSAIIVNKIVAVANTGGNTSNGGTITTGDAKAEVKVVNKVNINKRFIRR